MKYIDVVDFVENYLGISLFPCQKNMLRKMHNDRDTSMLYFRAYPMNLPIWISYFYSQLLRDEIK